MRNMKIGAVAFLLSITNLVFTQPQGDYYLGFKMYPFINYENNRLIYPGDSNCMEGLYQKLDDIIGSGTGKINIVHIGGSHIQADIYTHQIRKRLQSLQYDLNGGRGFIFPFRMARTNNPSNYSVRYTGSWNYCKNTQYKRTCPLGLSGMAVSTTQKQTSVHIDPNNDQEAKFSFNSVKVFHSPTPYALRVLVNDSIYSGKYDPQWGITEFDIEETNTLTLRISCPDTISSSFTLYGISLDNNDPGIVYNSIGVNGARLSSYLNCEYYSQHISALKPDLVIFSIGTNDGNTRHLNAEKYKNEYEQLIEITKTAAPQAKILITVPNDCYYYKRYANPNTAILRKEIISLAKEKNYAVWDFYSIMGGFDSSRKWYNYGLMRYDRIHFNKKGYLLKGELFVSAFLRGWEKNLAFRTSDITTKGKELAADSQISKDNTE